MVDLVAKRDDSVHIGFKSQFVACCSDNHERSAAALFRNLEEFARCLALDMVAFSVMPERSQQEMPGFLGASEKRHKFFLVSKCVWRQAYLPLVLPQEEMLPENFVCFGPKFDVDRDEIVSSVSTFLQDTYRGW